MPLETILMALKRTASREEFVASADRNEYVQQYRQDKAWWSCCWTEEAISSRPPMRVEFQQAVVFGSFSEAVSIRRGKTSWGNFVGIEPLRADDFLHPCRVVYTLKATNRMKMRWLWRNELKRILGRDRRLVNDAVRQTKKAFLREISESDVRILERKLGLAPASFWSRSKFGERWGPDGAREFIERLEERTKDYRLSFEGQPVQGAPEA